MRTTFVNISKLYHISHSGQGALRGKELGTGPISENAWLQIEGDKILDWGSMEALPDQLGHRIDAKGGLCFPTFVDSHTHLVYAATREDEFAKRLAGMSYAEIASAGGGILNSVARLRRATFQELYQSAEGRLTELLRMGTGALEIKSGYGLSLEDELKMLQVAKALEERHPVRIKKTLLAAHAIPNEFKGRADTYVEHICSDILPEAHRQGLVDYVDVFCEEGYFTVEQTLKIQRAAAALGLKSKLHVNQFTAPGIVIPSIEEGALSLDHLEVLPEEELKALAASNTIATLLPGCSYFLEIPYGPARALADANALLCLATDYNPGSAPSGNMAFALSLACVKMKLRPEEALAAATLNGAAALELEQTHGSISKGKLANFILTKPMEDIAFIPYTFGHHHIQEVWLNGKAYA